MVLSPALNHDALIKRARVTVNRILRNGRADNVLTRDIQCLDIGVQTEFGGGVVLTVQILGMNAETEAYIDTALKRDAEYAYMLIAVEHDESEGKMLTCIDCKRTMFASEVVGKSAFYRNKRSATAFRQPCISCLWHNKVNSRRCETCGKKRWAQDVRGRQRYMSYVQPT